MSDEHFYRHRRNLNVVSIALIIYFVSGGEFSRGAEFASSFAFGVAHPAALYALAWLLFFYFWWCFYLYGNEPRRRWKMDYLYALSKNEKYRSLYPQPEGGNQHETTVWAPSMHGQGFRRYLSWEEAHLVGLRTGDGQIEYAAPETFRDSVNPLTQKWIVGPETIMPLKWRHYALPALKATVSALTNKSGVEWALPNILAGVALVCGIAAVTASAVS